jgi:hypothetical protein
MASSPARTLPELQPPDDETEIRRSFEGYRLAIQGESIPALIERLSRINVELEAQAQALLRTTISAPLDSYISSLDILVPRTTPTRSTPPSPRGQSALRSPSQPPTAADLLFGGSRGRRLAAKLVGANARSIAKHRR